MGIKETAKKITLTILNLYSKPFVTTKYERHFTNVPVERLTYYPDLHQAYLTVAYREDDDTSTYTARVPEMLMKVVAAHASKGRRIAFFTDKNHVMGHVFFGEESHLEILRQIEEGFRPAGWGNPKDKGWEDWKKKQRQLRQSDPDDKKWGYADVLVGNPPYLGYRKKED